MKNKLKKIMLFIVRTIMAPNNALTSFSFTIFWLMVSNIIYQMLNATSWVQALLIDTWGMSYFWGTVVFILTFVITFEIVYHVTKVIKKIREK